MPLSREQLDTLQRVMEERRAALAIELRGDAERSRKETFSALAGPVTDKGDEAVADLMSDIDHAELSRDLAEFREIEAALARLAAGGYGLCADCNDEIPDGRLRVQPAALRCVKCQSKHEKTHAGTAMHKL